MDRKKIVIIGNGISGITAARNIRKKSTDEIIVISSESDYFFSRTALMYIYMGHMKYEHTKPYQDDFWLKNDIQLINKHVNHLEAKDKQLLMRDGSSIRYDQLIIATGSKPNKFGWPGQDLGGVQGLYSLQDLQLMEENTRKGVSTAVIVGGGLIGVEMAEMLRSRDIAVIFLVREDQFWGNVLPEEEAKMIGAHMVKDHHVDLRTKTELKEIVQDDSGRVGSIITSGGEVIKCQFVGLTAGVSPNVEFLRNSTLDVNRGVLVNEFLETNLPGVYAIGDCAEFKRHPTGRRNIEQVWYTGRMMGETVAETICGKRTAYLPGNWFNSAKFFDIEYQTYGWVFPQPKDNEEHYFWQHPTENIALRLVFEKESELFKGLNVFGMRLRHAVVDKWLKNAASVDQVVAHLKDANFDPEFYKKHEDAILMDYNQKYNKNLKAAPRNWKRIFQLS